MQKMERGGPAGALAKEYLYLRENRASGLSGHGLVV